MFGKLLANKMQKKSDKEFEKVQNLGKTASMFKKEVLESPYFKEKNEVLSIEEFYKIPEVERIMTTTSTRINGKKFDIPMLKDGCDVETLLYRHNIFMEKYFRPSIEKEKTSTPKEIKELRSPKRFKKWYKENKELVLKTC